MGEYSKIRLDSESSLGWVISVPRRMIFRKKGLCLERSGCQGEAGLLSHAQLIGSERRLLVL